MINMIQETINSITKYPKRYYATEDKMIHRVGYTVALGMMAIGVRISIDAGKTWEAPWVIHQFGDLAKDIGYPSTVLLDKEGSLLTAFYTDFEQSIKKQPDSYRVLAKYWSLQDWLQPKIKLAISDGKHLRL